MAVALLFQENRQLLSINNCLLFFFVANLEAISIKVRILNTIWLLPFIPSLQLCYCIQFTLLVFFFTFSHFSLFILLSSYRMCRPEDIQKELDDYNRPVQRNRSIDDCLDSTDALTQWAMRKVPQFDPENRRPIPVCISIFCFGFHFYATLSFFF